MTKKNLALASVVVLAVAILLVTFAAVTNSGRADKGEEDGAATAEKPKLSEMSEEEIARFLEERGIVLSELCGGYLEEIGVKLEDHVDLVNMMKLIEESPDSLGRLSSLGEEECMRILFELGVVIPQSLEGQGNPFELVAWIEEIPERPGYYNWPEVEEVCQEIRDAIMRYYGLTHQSESMFVNCAIGQLYKEASEAVKQYYGWDA